MLQFSFEDVAYQSRTKKTRNQRFLEQMDAVLPWEAFLSELEPFYPRGAKGRPPVGLDTMLRIYFMQQWFGHSDPGMEDALHDNIPMRRFARLEAGYSPDETTICKFRHWLEERELTKRLLSISNKHLLSHGIMVREGSIVDATIVSAPVSTKNLSGERDPEMKSTRKANKWHFGMKAHIGTDTQGYVHSVEVTAANVHDVTMMEQCLHGEEKEIYGDKGYACRKRKEKAESQGVSWRVLRKAARGRKLTCADASFNRKSNRTRARVEHPFGVVKHLWGYGKTRYRGLRKNAAQVYTLFALANFYMARKKLIAVAG